MRLIYYYLIVTPRYVRQWINSIRSLRLQNRAIRVSLFVFNDVPEELSREAQRHGVSVHPLGTYSEWMMRRPHPHGDLLARYPAMGQLLMLGSEGYARDVSQALYVDCDTFFFRDPELLLEECGEHDCYGREIPGSRLCPHGQSANLDENLLAEIVSRECLRSTIPLNTGVRILGKRMLDALPRIEELFLEFAWRLMVGLQLQNLEPGAGAQMRDRVRSLTANAVETLRREIFAVASQDDLQRALPYPSDNGWILPEIAWLLALGRVDGISQHVFSAGEVAQGEECLDAIRNRALPTIGHYFTYHEKDFLELLVQARARAKAAR